MFSNFEFLDLTFIVRCLRPHISNPLVHLTFDTIIFEWQISVQPRHRIGFNLLIEIRIFDINVLILFVAFLFLTKTILVLSVEDGRMFALISILVLRTNSLNMMRPHPLLSLHIAILLWVGWVFLHQHELECFHVLQKHIPILLQCSIFVNASDMTRFVDDRGELLLSVRQAHQLGRQHWVVPVHKLFLLKRFIWILFASIPVYLVQLHEGRRFWLLVVPLMVRSLGVPRRCLLRGGRFVHIFDVCFRSADFCF